VCYLGGVQPWRAIAYVVHKVVEVLMLIHIGSTVIAYL
jgi:hypothetical protein